MAKTRPPRRTAKWREGMCAVADLYTPRAKPGWISLRPYSGGEMTGWGAHGLDQVQWALGMDDAGPGEVWTEGEKLVAPKQTEPGPGFNKVCALPKVFFTIPETV